MNSMGRKGIVKELRERVGIPKKEAEAILEAILAEITNEVYENGNTVSLTNFGNFSMCEKAARMGRNLQDNTPHPIHARSRFSFVPADKLKKSIKEA